MKRERNSVGNYKVTCGYLHLPHQKKSTELPTNTITSNGNGAVDKDDHDLEKKTDDLDEEETLIVIEDDDYKAYNGSVLLAHYKKA